MENKNENDYKFDIIADEKEEFEDIVSDSSKLEQTGAVSLNSFSVIFFSYYCNIIILIIIQQMIIYFN